MQPAKTDTPHIPLRSGGWPTSRRPRWLIAVGTVLLVIAVLVSLARRPTQGQRATDLRGLLQTLQADVGSCAAGVRESLTLLRTIDSGASHDVTTALSEVNYGASNCSPANNTQLEDLTNVQVPESLRSYNLNVAVARLVDWAAPNAITVQHDVAVILQDRGKPGEPAARAALSQALQKLNSERALVYAALDPAIRALSPHAAPPRLYG